MPTPDDQVETVTNPDGSTTTTTTSFYPAPNGQPRQVKRETRDPAGDLREINVANLDRQGRRKDETNVKLDNQGRQTERTETDFDLNGLPKGRVRTVFDGQNRPATTTIEKFANGDRKAIQTIQIDYGARPPRKVVTTEKLCPDGIQVELRETRVFFNRAGRWQEERRERTTEKFDCESGRSLSLGFPQGPEDFALMGFAALAVIAAVAVRDRESNLRWAAGFVLGGAAAILYARFESRLRLLRQETGDLLFSICDDNEVAESDEGKPLEEASGQ